jgi:hypothetical protein
MRHVIAVDPGLKTGVAVYSFDGTRNDPVLLDSVELTEAEFAPYIRAHFEAHPDTEVACEKFTITMKTAKLSQAPYSLELIGVLKQILRDAGRPVEDMVLQMPENAKNKYPNAALKKLGYWHVGGAGHALDGIRHGLLYIENKSAWMPTKLLD